jgi:hypothetical protein
MTACVTLDLEPDYGGRLEPAFTGWEPGRIDELVGVLKDHGAALTVFVVGDCLKARPEAIDRLKMAGAEFHLHSYSHDLSQPDSLSEIQLGVRAFEEVFGHRPRGYRAPEGRISLTGWRHLEAEGFEFDSSIFPSFWPAPRYLRFPSHPFRPAGHRLLELPVSTLTPFRLIVSLSWMKLLGWSLYKPFLEHARWPDPLVFDMHLHDLFALPSYRELSPPWNWIYGRNHQDGMKTLDAFLKLLGRKGQRFSTLGTIAQAFGASPGPTAEGRV